jgi:hypothetical protein
MYLEKEKCYLSATTFFFAPFAFQSRYQGGLTRRFGILLYFTIPICYARCYYSGWMVYEVFGLQENLCWFPKKFAVFRSCLYSPSISEMFNI